MAVRTKQLATAHLTDVFEHTVYTVPAGYVTIVKSLVFQTSAAAAQRAVWSVVLGSTTLFAAGVSLAAAGANGESQVLLPYVVMSAGQKLDVTFGATGGWVLASGAELLL